MMQDLLCWHNGAIKPIRDVSISIFDFGFIHCDGTYDVLRAHNFHPLFLSRHLERFSKSCEYFGFSPLPNPEEIIHQLLRKNKLANAFVWLCVWRGAPPTGSPRDLSGPQQSVVYVKPYYGLSQKQDFRVCIHRENRRVPDECYNQRSKNFAWIELTLAQRCALERGFDSAVVLDLDGYVTEGPGFSICFVSSGQVLTPSKNCLGSVTVDVVGEVCSRLKIPFIRRRISENEALRAEEVFLCSTSGGLTLVPNFEGRILSQDVSSRIKKAYEDLVVELCGVSGVNGPSPS